MFLSLMRAALCLAALCLGLAAPAAAEENGARPQPRMKGVLTFDLGPLDLGPKYEDPRHFVRRAEEWRETTAFWPVTLEAAVADILKGLSGEDRRLVRDTPREELIRFHMGWGMAIRNGYGLWNGNKALLVSACGGEICHPDSASMRIIEGVWEKLRAESPTGEAAAPAGE